MQPDEPQLVDRSRDGDLSAFNAIVERYQSQVYNVSARILGDRHLAEDVAQETFIKAHRSIDGFRGGSLRAWLLRIASNLSLDATRSRKRRPAESLEAASERPGFSVPSDAPGPEQEALQGELREAIQDGIMSLPDDQRAVVVLVDVQGLSYDEAAEAIGSAVGTVKSRLARGRRRLRDALMEHRELLPAQFRQIDRGRASDG
ncbi:MAG: sigma-70 family RNA polymerase sigma factor [Dehalococcoidia bacterium]|nr:sigma-70 family RNA polymerase sigma factor [Dehalococcoidia bacterium]